MCRALALLAAGFAIALPGCGDEAAESRLGEDQVRTCLAEAGLSAAKPPNADDTAGLAPTTAVPDFVLYTDDGTAVVVALYGTDEKAERAAADINGAIQSVGGANASEVVRNRNAVVIFNLPPPDETRELVEDCLQ